MNIKSILVKLLPMLYKLSTQIWYNYLSPSQRDTATKAVRLVEYLKKQLNVYDAGYLSLKANQLFGLNLPVEKIAALQAKVKSGIGDFEYNQELKGLSEYIAQNNSPEPIDWKYYAFGIMQIAYEQFTK